MSDRQRRLLSNALVVIGALILLAVAGYFGFAQVSAERLREELRAESRSTPGTQLVIEVAPEVATAPAEAGASTGAVTASVADSGNARRTGTSSVPPVTTGGGSDGGNAGYAAPESDQPARAKATPTSTRTAAPPTATARATRTATKAPTATAVAGVEPVRMTIAGLKIDAKVVPMTWQVVNTKNGPVSEWVIPKNEAGHHVNSVKLGEPGNLVISGHNNIYGRVFLRISQAWDNTTRIKVDDFTDRSDILKGQELVLFDATGKAYRYVVSDFYRVRDTGVSQDQRIRNGRFIQPTETTQVTIVTCWPPTNNTHRLVVIAQPAK